MFKKFFIIDRNLENYEYIYPDNLSHSANVVKTFLYPCEDFERYEHGNYVVVLTEISGNKNFITTRYIKETNISIAFESDHPWFEIVYSIMNNVINSQLYLPANRFSLEKYLSELSVLPYPEPGVTTYIPAADFNASAVKIVVPMKSRQKPFSVFLMSLHKQIQFDDWVIIFESLLLERWIVFHSRHLNRVTNCVFAALSLICPLEWVHLIFPCLPESSINCLGCPSPFLAGIHSCLIDKVLPFLSPGTLIVNIDEGVLNFVTSDFAPESDEHNIPRCLVNFLSRNLSNNELKMCESRKLVNNDEQVTRACRLVVNGFMWTMGVLFGKYKNCTVWKPETNRYSINNSTLAQSRGDVLQPFLSKVLQSQMVHQFLDDRINQTDSAKTNELTFAVDHIDDFEEACKCMNKWHPDHYTEVIANMASRSRRKINDLAIKVRDIAKKTPFGAEVLENGETKYIGNTSNVQEIYFSTSSETVKEPLFESNVCKNKWITFEDDNFRDEDLFVHDWKTNEEEANFENIFENGPQKIFNENSVDVVIKDFDPFYQN